LSAKDLKEGMQLQTNHETFVSVDRVDRRDENVKVYNFEVEGFHTYFVSDLGILVHNSCDPSTPVGRRGSHLQVPPPSNSATTIGNREFSGHSLDRMQEQGLVPSVVENAIQNGQANPGNTIGTVVYYDNANNVSVVVNTSANRVITADFGDFRR
jgi:Pretoxin HINT domain/Domain of unknown function (DUF4258)